jgi:gluconolactonase
MQLNSLFAVVTPLVAAGMVLAQTSAPAPGPAPAQGRGRGPQGPREVTVAAIPGIIAAGAQWKIVWQALGNNGDGLVGLPGGSLLVAQNDLSQVLKIDKDDKASVYLTNTNTGGAISIDSQGRLLMVNRSAPMAVAYVAPERKVIADTYQGKPLTDLGRLNDLVADKKGGAYFTVTGAFYASTSGQVTSLGDGIRANGIILSQDEKTLYVTNGNVILAFDVQPDGSVANRKDFGKLEAGGSGDGMTIDSTGRLYVSTGPGVQILSPDGKYVGIIPSPRNIISTAFSGPDKRTLYIVCSGGVDADGKEFTGQSATIYKIPMLAQGFLGRAK